MRLGFQFSPSRQVFASLAVYVFVMDKIFSRSGDVQTQMGVTTGSLGLGLIGAPIGTLLALTFASPLLDRSGDRAALLAGIPLMARALLVVLLAGRLLASY